VRQVGESLLINPEWNVDIVVGAEPQVFSDVVKESLVNMI
jgi:hypothetical protein